jgi:uncharacterized membrane protein YgcG
MQSWFDRMLGRGYLGKPAGLTPPFDRLWDRADQAYKWSDKGTRSWSFAYHLVFGAATLSTALITSLSGRGEKPVIWSWLHADDLISVLSILATVLTALGAFGGFERKWRANRVTRTRLWALLTCIEHQPKDMTAEDVCEKLERILTDHDAGILSEKPPQAPAAKKPDATAAGAGANAAAGAGAGGAGAGGAGAAGGGVGGGGGAANAAPARRD